ncbi:MAG: GMC family oxidoreductase N-terminal domain-containing protein, partial [Gemmatimonadales bacterium]
MSLSRSTRETLTAVCDALVPPYDDRVLDMGVSERAEQLIARLPDPADRTRLSLLLHALGSRVASLVGIGRLSRFHRLPRGDRERILASWATAPLQLPRTGFQALKRLVYVAHYCWPGPDGSHPAWETAGYSGPLPQPDTGVPPHDAESVERDTTIDCDVVVIGSGAGGGVVAGVLAGAGRDVVVLEQGPNPGAKDMTQIEGDMLDSLYLDGGLMMTQSGSMPVLAGGCVGGGTVINYTTSFELPDSIREQWDRISGLKVFSEASFGDAVKRVSERIGVNIDSTPGTR